jgi:hypothetical protein
VTATFVLVLINTLVLACMIISHALWFKNPMMASLERFEAVRVGWIENHQIMKEIYSLDAYKADQKARLEQTLNTLKTK